MLSVGVEEEDRKVTWMEDADNVCERFMLKHKMLTWRITLIAISGLHNLIFQTYQLYFYLKQ